MANHETQRRFLIVGAAGFIGRALAEFYHSGGHSVRAVDLRFPEGVVLSEGIERITASLLDREAMGQALRGVDVVIQCAAIVSEDGHWGLFRSVNVDGPRQLAELAIEQGVREFAQLSSVMVYGFDYPDGVDEDGPLNGAGNPYCATKIEGERALREVFDAAGEDTGTRLTLIRPGDVYGPGSGPWVVRPVQMIDYREMVIPDMGRGLMNAVYIDNLIAGIHLALSRPDDTPETYNFVDQQLPWRAYLSALTEGRRRRAVLTLPTPAASALLRFAKLFGAYPGTTPAAINFMCRRGSVSATRAREVLGWSPHVAFDDAMQVTREWLNTRA